ncbi:Na+/H+ antiporter [soil metagenome]
MEAIVTILTLLLAVIVSGSLARFTRLPLPLVQIALGIVLALSFVKTVELKPEIFFLLFLPPLLFLDGWRIPKASLIRDRAVILELSLGLVVMTVIGAGFLIHWLIPAMPLPVAFALAAVVSPTDPIAVSAIASRTPIPKRMLHVLEGESLLNDASGLVCMRFAVAAMLTGSFSLSDAFLTFLWVALGGVAIGVCVTWSVTRIKQWVTNGLGEDTSAQIMISLLMPFGAYLVAEHFHCSGILAAVSAGVTMGLAEQTGQALGVTRVHRAAVWDTVQFAANGVIFVLLGEQLPGIMAGAAKTVLLTGHNEPWWLAIYVLLINLGLAALRFAWVWTSLRLTLFRAVRRGDPPRKTSWKLVLAISLAGVRGAITLAGVLTLPLTLTNGAAFPARDLAIFLAAGVIVVSLMAASIVLPHLLKNLALPLDPSSQAQEDAARGAAAEAAIRAIEAAQHAMAEGRADADVYTETAARIMALYRQRIEGNTRSAEAQEISRGVKRIERQLRLAGVRAERDEVFRLGRERELDEEDAARLIRELDLLEARYAA